MWERRFRCTVFIVLRHETIGTFGAVSRGEIGKQLENAIVHLTPLNIEKQTLLEVVGVECLLSEELLRVNVCVNRHFPSWEST